MDKTSLSSFLSVLLVSNLLVPVSSASESPETATAPSASTSLDIFDLKSAESDSFVYMKIYSMVEEMLQNEQEKAEQQSQTENESMETTKFDSVRLRNFKDAFLSTCGDARSLTSAHWKIIDPASLPNETNVNEGIASEVTPFSPEQKRTVAISFQCSNPIRSETGNIFYMVFKAFDGKISSMDSFSMFDVSLEKNRQLDKPSAMKIVLRESVGMMVATAITVSVMTKMYPSEKDKIKHGGGSSLLTASLASFFYHYMGLSKEKATMAGLSGSLIIGISVEVIQPYLKFRGSRGTRDTRDFYADSVGSALGAGGFYLSFLFN